MMQDRKYVINLRKVVEIHVLGERGLSQCCFENGNSRWFIRQRDVNQLIESALQED